jgi:hypothetical protein
MAKAPAFAKAFAGRWRIVETHVFDNDVLDEFEEAHITFKVPTARSPSPPSAARWMSATALATDRPARSSPGRASTTTSPPAGADG